jgi:hypothetical protein
MPHHSSNGHLRLQVFATAYNKLVNARHVSFEYDIVPQASLAEAMAS